MDDFARAFALASEALSRLHVGDRRSQEAAAASLSQQISAMSHEAPSEDIFTKSLNEINRRIYDLIHSSSAADRQGGILAIDRILEVADYEEIYPNLARYANYLRVVIPTRDTGLMREASVCLGKILAKGGPSVYEMVDFELNRVFQWLQGPGRLRGAVTDGACRQVGDEPAGGVLRGREPAAERGDHLECLPVDGL